MQTYDPPCHLLAPSFYERPTLVPVFTNRKKSEEDVHFYEKRQKAKIASGFVLHLVVIEAADALSRESGPARLLPRELHSSRHHLDLCL